MRKNGVDEKVIRATARAIAAQEAAKIVERRIAEFRSEIEEKLSRLGFDAVSIRELVNELYGKLINDVRQMLDQRIMHILGEIDEQTNSIRDVLDLVSEVLKAEVETEETLSKLKNMLDEEHLEELIYRVLIRRGLIRRRKRKWVWIAVGLGILAAIIVGLVVNPIVTLVILFITFVILMRW